MLLIVISSPVVTANEAEIVTELFKNGLEVFHWRKPGASEEATSSFLKFIPLEYRSRIVMHQTHDLYQRFSLGGIHFTEKGRADTEDSTLLSFKKTNPGISLSTSFHTVEQLLAQHQLFDYAFIGPLFQSISKPGYGGGSDQQKIAQGIARLKQQKARCKVIGLGGIVADKIPQLYAHGFEGAAVLGAVWNDPHPLKRFLELKNAVDVCRF